MATIRAYTDISQSKKLAEILPLESADMTLPFRHPKNDEYIPGYVVSRNYVEVYNEMMKLPAMEKEDVCKLIQPSWSLTALLSVLPDGTDIIKDKTDTENEKYMCTVGVKDDIICTFGNNPVDACAAMIEKLNEQKML